MRIGTWLTLTGMSGLLGACGGESILGIASDGGSAGAGGERATIQAGAGGEAGQPDDGGAGSAGTPAMGGGGFGGISAGGVGGVVLEPLGQVDAQKKADKLDVLFVVDNSLSMSDKQSVLGRSVDAFVSRLLNPRCVNAQGAPVATQPTSGSAECSTGKREFTPVTDVHLAAITTSLGAHGGTVCGDPSASKNPDDKAQLLASVRDGVASYEDTGFLAFDASGKQGSPDGAEVSSQLSAMINAAGQEGCGFEATLESMYRFLIDPSPPKSVELVSGASTPRGVNDVLLAQREAFLRPDSSLAIVILSDENDCSIQDTGVGWFVGSSQRMPLATTACDEDQNDPCCRSCALNESAPPAGCEALKKDANCSLPPGTSSYPAFDARHDSLNLRCYDQQRRFGFDLLNPIQRYTTGLTNPQVRDWDGTLVPNPLFAARDGKGPRSNSLVSISVIVGAPWQDLATSDSLSGDGLTFLSASGLESARRFPMLIGAGEYGTPTDPLMIETPEVRSGTSPLTSEPLVSAKSTNPLANAANGHEQNIPYLDDLQYACTFPLPEPKECADGDPACNCSADKTGDTQSLTDGNSPLCQPPTGGPASTTQYFGRGYPGLRQLRVARALGNRAAFGSICPKQTSDSALDSFGYVPALNALVDRIAVTLK